MNEYYKIENSDRQKPYFFTTGYITELQHYLKITNTCKIEIYGRAWRVVYYTLNNNGDLVQEPDGNDIFFDEKPQIEFISIDKENYKLDLWGECGDETADASLIVPLKEYMDIIEYIGFVENNLSYFNYKEENISNIQKEIITLNGIEFEYLIKRLLEKMDFDVYATKVSGDGGIDLIAQNIHPIIGGKYIIQCKRWNGSVGEPMLRDLYGVVMSERANKGILITNSYFTTSAVNFSQGKQLELIDGIALNSLMEKYLPEYLNTN